MTSNQYDIIYDKIKANKSLTLEEQKNELAQLEKEWDATECEREIEHEYDDNNDDCDVFHQIDYYDHFADCN